ncbi:SDR family oxidoreductase [Pirellulales bacterium]|nr:SDR family oxidoreductase [Pirellulales bacterium]
MKLLAGKRAVVTGSSRGIGKAIAAELAAAGARVVVHGGHDAAAIEQTAREIAKLGDACTHVVADLSIKSGRDDLVARVCETDPPDIWVNNAGVDVLTGPATDWDFDRKLAALWEVDVCATMALTRAVGEQMKERGEGTILNIGWDQADVGMGGDSGEMFAATKGAVMAFTRSAAKSLAPEVRVNCIAPGWIRTAWGEEASEYWQKRAVGEALLQCWGTPADVAATALFLVSPGAAFITGQILHVNGGDA